MPPRRLLLAVLPLCALAISGQSNDVRTPPKPMVRSFHNVELDNVRYSIPIYQSYSSTDDDQRRYYYYPPAVQLVKTESGKLKVGYQFEDGSMCGAAEGDCTGEVRRLILYAQKTRIQTHIEATLEEEVRGWSKNNVVGELDGEFWFRSDGKDYPKKGGRRAHIVSETAIQGAWRTVDERPIRFPIESREQADLFVRNVERKYEHVVFVYQFEGVSVDECVAHYDGTKRNNLRVNEDREGNGKEGFVSSERISRIVQKAVDTVTLTEKCGDEDRQQSLRDQVTRWLVDTDDIKELSWEEAENMLTLEDRRAFLADVTTSVKSTIKERREQSGSKDTSVGGSAEMKVPLVGEGGIAVDQKDKATFDTVVANGMAYEWNGMHWVPKSIFVAHDDSLKTSLERKGTFNLGSSSVGKNRNTVDLHKNGWITELEDTQRESIHSRLDELEAFAEDQTHIKSCYVEGRMPASGVGVGDLGGEEWDHAWISSEGANVHADVSRAHSNGPWFVRVLGRSRFNLTVAFARGTHVRRSNVRWTRLKIKAANVKKFDCG